uniref:Protein phosphatase 1 regulatory subunit 15A n=1 Tax=Anolis carolinensis TaxID=28377 RepID=A0A803TY72_ANOCA|nr:PREDICTED: protein phosphatase 1 regulatory subunit 15A [Anolis carolinensis]|eukprot:XP_008117123.1 PREDICTED: protein phosphatase 1 regulatory subunit 15A [Anolis carolinensis]
MPPDITACQVISHTPNSNKLLLCSDPFGLRMAKSLPPQLNASTSVGKMSIGAMIVAMDWLRKCWHLWQNFPANLMAAIWTGIARWAMPILEKTVNHLEGKGFERGGSQIESQNLKRGHLEYLIMSSHGRSTVKDTESLVEDGYFAEYLSGFECAEMDKMHMEEDGFSELCSMSPSIFLDIGNYWEGSSKKVLAPEDMENHRDFSKEWLEDGYHPQIDSRIAGIFGKNLQNGCSQHEEINDFEEGLWQILESTSVFQKEKGQMMNNDLAMHEDQSSATPLSTPKIGELLEMNVEDGDEGAKKMQPTSAPCDFKSSLVLSLFYSPSEEEGDEEDDSEDSWSEDETDASTPLGLSLHNSDSGNGTAAFEAEDEFLENLCGPFSMNNDPFHPLCFSKPTKAVTPPSSSPPKPKNHEEITVSFYLMQQDSKPEQLCGPSKQPWPRKDPRATHRRSIHNCCQPDTGKSYDTVTSETSSTQDESQVIKKVRFSSVVTIHPLIAWDYAYRTARRGPWEEMARDRCRFHRRIAQVGAILQPCLEMEHRAKMWRKLHGVQDCATKEDNTKAPLLSSSAKMKELDLQSLE